MTTPCRICGTDLARFDIEYHYGKNHLTQPNAEDFILGYRDACRMIEALREENARLTRERDEARALLAPMSCHHIKWCDDDGRCTVCTLHACIAEAEAEVSRLEGLILDWEEDANDHCWKDLEDEARRIRAQREEVPEVWRCEGCGETFDGPRHSHGRADHAPGCDGSCRSCPVEVECGPITAQREEGR